LLRVGADNPFDFMWTWRMYPIYRIRATAGLGGSCGLGELALLAVPRTQCSLVQGSSPIQPSARPLGSPPPPRALEWIGCIIGLSPLPLIPLPLPWALPPRSPPQPPGPPPPAAAAARPSPAAHRPVCLRRFPERARRPAYLVSPPTLCCG
jgi:hypothetical protein